MGTDFEGEGKAEQRAAAYGVVVDQLPRVYLAASADVLQVEEKRAPWSSCISDPQLARILKALRNALWWGTGKLDGFKDVAGALALMHQELCIQRDAEAQWENLLHTLAPACFSWDSRLTDCAVLPPTDAKPKAKAQGVLIPTQDLVEAAICAVADAMGNGDEPSDCGTLDVGIPATAATGTEMLSGTRDRNGKEIGTLWSPDFKRYLVERIDEQRFIEPVLRVTRTEATEVMNVVLASVPPGAAQQQVVAQLVVLGLSESGAKAAVSMPYTTILEGVAKTRADEVVNALKAVNATAYASPRLTRHQATACFDVVLEQPPDALTATAPARDTAPPQDQAQAPAETPSKRGK
jgi:hypothetical protein